MNFTVTSTGIALDWWPGTGPAVILLHSGITDRRCWRTTAEILSTGEYRIVAYDRRGYGETALPNSGSTHADDLADLIEGTVEPSCHLVGSSAGASIALEVAFRRPELVQSLTLIAPAIVGAPEPAHLDASTEQLSAQMQEATAHGDEGRRNEVETWLWLDGPAEMEGRVQGAARGLVLESNQQVIERGRPESVGNGTFDAWQALPAIHVPTLVIVGMLDVPYVQVIAADAATRMQHASLFEIPDAAHLPYLEKPEIVTGLIHMLVTSVHPGPDAEA